MPTDAELEKLRGDVMTSLARIEGDVRLLIERGEHAHRRIDEADARHTQRSDGLERKADRLDERMDRMEATAVTHEQLKERDEARSRRNLALAGLAMTGTGILSGAGVAIATSLIK